MTKYIEKTIEDQTTGADVNYHEVTYVGIDFVNNLTTATVTSYISSKTKKRGKAPIGDPKQLSINTTPPENEGLVDWLLKNLTQDVPADYQQVPEEEQYDGYIDPYMFSGGEIKDSEAKAKGK
ncbi:MULTISPECIES: hypothetical protein [Pasteurellaceae]|uniref:Phage protein n=1 Tax=Pasteurella atlantica TaxID=2827233 RepID=A0AAW8CSL7_9PAST|nr:hypothetical protein [Pasteurella atlantica]MBR0574535.1 hypothetical protein [Pasteurella atlantica]MDP8040402.1 hypothetical protein [Pasteurella atlantica]MDP8042548.1 hypothetical protein [Pasteurella atlantica]MDP8044672.1 hypothetical protein [Pasteurella atlantica]MDP8046699.1 hypothetical protein [Pasteurella atlantica]